MSATSAPLSQRLAAWAPVRAIQTKIRAKLIVTLVAASIVPLAILGVLMYRSASTGLMNQAANQLESVRTIKANQIERYFGDIQDQIATFSRDKMIVDAMRDFPSALHDARDEADVDAAELDAMEASLREYYAGDFAGRYRELTGGDAPVDGQMAPLDDDSRYLQTRYIAANPHPLGEKENLDDGGDGTTYDRLHRDLHPIVRDYLRRFGYYDIFLCDLESGDIVYSVYKELDFTTSLIDGPYAETNFGRAFRLAAAAEDRDSVFLVDYEPYLPSYEGAASFIASPVFEGDRKIGVAIFQMPIDRINAIMEERTGLGESGETYAVGSDGLFRSESRFTGQLGIDTAIINPSVRVDTAASRSASTGDTGSAVIDDYRGTPVLSAWQPITVYPGIPGVAEPIVWSLMSEIDYAEVTEPITASGLAANAGVVIVLGLVFALGGAFYFGQGITRQAESINDMLTMIGIGDFDARADVVTRDEMGDVAIALNAMCDNTLSLIQSQEERNQIETSIFELIQELEDIAAGDLTIQTQVRDDLTAPIAGSVNYMTDQLRTLVRRVQETTGRVDESAAAVSDVSLSLSRQSREQSETIGQTADEVKLITESFGEVATKSTESAKVAGEARERAAEGLRVVDDTVRGMDRIRTQVQETSKRIKRLGESSQEIGEIVQLIADIADRTSILALNASIQAAMAGDAGQGFAVVAEEVERLAERSNDATKQIATLIAAIQAETGEAITDMEESTREVVAGSKLATEAGATLREIDRVSTNLAGLIAEVSAAAEGRVETARHIAQTIDGVTRATRDAAERSGQAAEGVTALTALANELSASVATFKVGGETAAAEDDAPVFDASDDAPSFDAVDVAEFAMDAEADQTLAAVESLSAELADASEFTPETETETVTDVEDVKAEV